MRFERWLLCIATTLCLPLPALAAGTLDARGAMPCLGLLSREDYLAELEGLAITSALREY